MNVYFLYTVVVLLSVFFAFLSKRVSAKGVNKKVGFNALFFFLSFLVLCLFCVFTDTGADYYSYVRIINDQHDITSFERFINTEPIFTLWSYWGWNLFQDAHLVIVTMKVATLIVTYLAFYLARKDINIVSSVLAYSSLSYLPSFSLISITLASSFVTLAFVFLLKDKLIFSIAALLMMVIGMGLHFSCIIPSVSLIVYFVLFRSEKTRNHKKFLLSLLFLLLLWSTTQLLTIAELFVGSSEAFDHYQKYVDDIDGSVSSTGVIVVLLLSYMLIFYLLLKIKLYESNESRYFLLLVFSVFAFFFELISIAIPVAERIIYAFIAAYCIVLPYCLNKFRLSHSLRSTNRMIFIVYCFFIVRFYFVIRTRALPDSPSDLYYYHFYNPFL